MKFFKIFFIFVLLSSSCKDVKNLEVSSENTFVFDYIENVQIEENEEVLRIFSANESVEFPKNELPLKTAMVIPTVAISYMDELNVLDKISGISQPDYIFNPKIHQKMKENKIDVIGVFNEVFIEKILLNKPDVFISTSGPTLAKYHEILEKEGIRILYIDEYEESNPLARAEYVKIFGKLFGKETEAHSLFTEIVENYNGIKEKVKNSHSTKPKVMANQMYGDIWYVPGGKSFQSTLFKDAGGDYIWADNESESTLNLSFESVYEKALDADVWLNAGDFPNLRSLVASYPHYEWFQTVKNKKVYNWSKRSSASGANDYFENGTVRPDWVLKDLAAIFYPELFPNYELFFYKRLE